MNRALARRGRALAALLVLLSLAACGEFGERPALRLGSRSLSLEDLRTAYADLEPGARPSLASRADRRAFATRVVQRLLLVEEGERLIAADSAADSGSAREHRSFLVRRLRVVLTGSVGADSADVAAAFERMRARLRVESWMFGSEAAADGARTAISAGGTAGLPDSAGARLPDQWVTWSPSPDAVADAVADLPIGGVAGPVRVGPAWRVLRVADREIEDPGDLEEVRPRIVAGLRARREVAILDSLLTRLRSEAGVAVDSAAVARLADLTRAAILAPGASEQDASWAVPVPDAAAETLTVARWRDDRLDAAAYARMVARAGRSQRPRVALEREVRRIVESEIDSRLLAAEAIRRGLEDDRWVQRAAKRDREETAIQRALAGIQAGTPEDSAALDSLAVLLHETQPTLFQREARAQVLRMDSADRRTAEAEAARMSAGGPRARLAGILAEPAPPEAAYHVFWMTASETGSPEAAAAIFGGGPGAVSGPHRLGEVWAVFGCLDIRPPARPTRDEVLAQLRSRSGPPEAMRSEAWTQARMREEGLVLDDEVLDQLAPGG